MAVESATKGEMRTMRKGVSERGGRVQLSGNGGSSSRLRGDPLFSGLRKGNRFKRKLAVVLIK